MADRLRDQAAEVVRRLKAKPELYAAVLAVIASDRVVGPWEHRRGDWWEREDVTGESLAQVAPLPHGGGLVGWQWQVRGGQSGNGSGPEDCKAAVDNELRRLGYAPR